MTAGDPHNEVSALLGAFALDAVDPAEAELVAEHLRTCVRCRAEVDQLREVAAAIGNSSEPPSEDLWNRIAARLDRPSGAAPSGEGLAQFAAPGLAPVAEPRRAPTTLGAPEEPPAPGAAAPPAEGRAAFGHFQHAHGPRSSRRAVGRAHRRRRMVTGAGVGAAAACAVLAAVFGIGWSNASTRADQLQHALTQGGAAAVTAALSSSGHQVVRLRSTNGAQLAELVVERGGGGYVVASRMPGLPANETYQLWAKAGGQPISIGLLGAKLTEGVAFSLGSRSGANELMVTVEPSGGVVAPTGLPIAAGKLA